MNKLNLYNYRDILEIYPEGTETMDMTEMMSQVLRYYKNGDLWHKRHFQPMSRDEYEFHVTFLKEMRDMVENMCTEEECSLIIQDECVKLNLNPWLKFVSKYSLNDIISTIRAIKGCMVKYLNEDTIMEYRDSLEIMDRWEFAVTEMNSVLSKGGES